MGFMKRLIFELLVCPFSFFFGLLKTHRIWCIISLFWVILSLNMKRGLLMKMTVMMRRERLAMTKRSVLLIRNNIENE